MTKKIFLTNQDIQKSRIEKEKRIIESFSTIYNKIKRLDENEYYDGDDYEQASRGVEYGVNPYSDIKLTDPFKNIVKIEFARREFKGRISNTLYKFFIRHIDGTTERIASVEDFNLRFNTNLPPETKNNPNIFVNYMSENHPDIKIEIGEYDIS